MAAPVMFEAFIFPAVGQPRMFQLTTVAETHVDQVTGQTRMVQRPHPSLYMSISHNENWMTQPWETLYGMTTNLPNPFVVFYPERQQSREPLPVNEAIAEIQGRNYKKDKAWKGDIVVAKYSSLATGEIMNMNPSDYPFIRNYMVWAYPERTQT